MILLIPCLKKYWRNFTNESAGGHPYLFWDKILVLQNFQHDFVDKNMD
jgi:hypothetical protein